MNKKLSATNSRAHYMLEAELHKGALSGVVQQLDSAALAFSGGVDSSLLAYLAHQELRDRFVAVTVRSLFLAESELMDALAFCEACGIAHVVLDFDIAHVEGLSENPPNRCYLCKRAILQLVGEYAQKRGFTTILDGSNADDDPARRPGMRALAELGVRSPLREAGMSKDYIRELSKELGLPTWNKPSQSCLATKLPHGILLTSETLSGGEV